MIERRLDSNILELQLFDRPRSTDDGGDLDRKRDARSHRYELNGSTQQGATHAAPQEESRDGQGDPRPRR